MEHFDNEQEDFDLPDLPLPISLKKYNKKIIEKARKMSGGVSAEVDRLLKQGKGTEKQRKYRKRQS